MEDKYAYLGSTVQYPIEIINGKAKIVTGPAVIESSAIKILMTPLGSRIFLPEYGSRLNELMHEPNDEVLIRLLRTTILSALSKWETRARFVDVAAVAGEDMILCDIKYVILASNEVKSFVFPFYRNLRF